MGISETIAFLSRMRNGAWAPTKIESGITLSTSDSFTASDFSWKTIDSSMSSFKPEKVQYSTNYSDNYVGFSGPYVANSVRPFRLSKFEAWCSIEGYHTMNIVDYLVSHGFDTITDYGRTPGSSSVIPTGTKWLRWVVAAGTGTNPPNWSSYLQAMTGDATRYDYLYDADVSSAIDNSGKFSFVSGYNKITIDIEHPYHDYETLKTKPYYPSDPTEAELFTLKYYTGLKRSFTECVASAVRAGWSNISIYGISPFERTYWGLESAQIDTSDPLWIYTVKPMCLRIDAIHPSVYAFYPNRYKNGKWVGNPTVAYILANIDLNMQLINDAGLTALRVIPYFWHRYHYSGGGWFGGYPLRCSDVSAAVFMMHTTGANGFCAWDWTGMNDHTMPVKPAADSWIHLKKSMMAQKVDGSGYEAIPQDAAIYIHQVNSDGMCIFQVCDGTISSPYGITGTAPYYKAHRQQIILYSKSYMDSVASMVRALMLVKVFEAFLSDGAPNNPDSRAQFDTVEPIVRRVDAGNYVLITSYDPAWNIYYSSPRTTQITIGGADITVPCDHETRVWLLRT